MHQTWVHYLWILQLCQGDLNTFHLVSSQKTSHHRSSLSFPREVIWKGSWLSCQQPLNSPQGCHPHEVSHLRLHKHVHSLTDNHCWTWLKYTAERNCLAFLKCRVYMIYELQWQSDKQPHFGVVFHGAKGKCSRKRLLESEWSTGWPCLSSWRIEGGLISGRKLDGWWEKMHTANNRCLPVTRKELRQLQRTKQRTIWGPEEQIQALPSTLVSQQEHWDMGGGTKQPWVTENSLLQALM